jgi:hypothetical protein
MGYSALKYKNRNAFEGSGKKAQIVQDVFYYSNYNIHSLYPTTKDEKFV